MATIKLPYYDERVKLRAIKWPNRQQGGCAVLYTERILSPEESKLPAKYFLVPMMIQFRFTPIDEIVWNPETGNTIPNQEDYDVGVAKAIATIKEKYDLEGEFDFGI